MGKSSGAGQHGPRDTEAVINGRYWLTDKGEAVVAAIRETGTTASVREWGEGK